MRRLDNRVPPPVLALVVGAVMALTYLSPAALPTPWRWGAAALLFGAAGLFAGPAFAAFGRAKTTVDPVRIERASTLVTDGVYRYTRNPMYLALCLLLCALAAGLGRPLSLVGPLAFVAYITRFQIQPEERALNAKFGDAFALYRQRVRRWL